MFFKDAHDLRAKVDAVLYLMAEFEGGAALKDAAASVITDAILDHADSVEEAVVATVNTKDQERMIDELTETAALGIMAGILTVADNPELLAAFAAIHALDAAQRPLGGDVFGGEDAQDTALPQQEAPTLEHD